MMCHSRAGGNPFLLKPKVKNKLMKTGAKCFITIISIIKDP